jgi:hypothetical protein
VLLQPLVIHRMTAHVLHVLCIEVRTKSLDCREFRFMALAFSPAFRGGARGRTT